jgi:integrase/recombinase XerD
MKGAAEVLFRAHIEDLRVRGLAEASMGAARYVVPRLLSHLMEQGVHDLRTVKEEHVIAFARELATRPTKRGGAIALSTQRTYLGAVRRFFCFLVREEVLLEEPSRGLVLPRTERLPRLIPSESQVARLMAAPPADTALGLRDRAILELLYGTGLRLSECSRLDLMDVDLAAMTLLVRNGKGKKDRLLPIPARAGEALDAYLRRARSLLSRDPRERALFLSRDATRLTRTAIQLAVKWHGIGAGLPALSPHALRHACGTHLVRGGADLRHVQELLGHERIQTTAIYTSLDLSDLRTALEKCHPRERGLRKPA